jgi:hypothetical protein
MYKLKDYVKADSVPNIVVKQKETGQKVVFFAVHSDDDSVLLGPIEGRNLRDWSNKCWVISKKDLLENFILD